MMGIDVILMKYCRSLKRSRGLSVGDGFDSWEPLIINLQLTSPLIQHCQPQIKVVADSFLLFTTIKKNHLLIGLSDIGE